VDKFRIRRPVVPGDQLRIEATVLKVKSSFWRFKARATVEGANVAEGEFLAAISKEGWVK
jgi:3-hydroxyacyl-[acyl-carrier-protein] dehydratase